MKTKNNNELLDFLAEGFLEQGASVTFTKVGEASALKVTAEDVRSQLYIPAEEEVLKVTFLKQLTSEEIIIPVLKSDEEFRLKSLLKRAGITSVKVQRLSILQRYAWYSRKINV